MTSTPTSGQVALPSGSTSSSSTSSFTRPAGLTDLSSGRPRNTMDDDNDSGDEWDMEIPVGDLIIDLDAVIQKDEQRKNDARNTNNNNSLKGASCSSMSKSTVRNNSPQERCDSGGGSTNRLFKSSSSASTNSSGNNGPVVTKSKSKAKKSSRSAAGTKHTNSSLGSVEKTDSRLAGDIAFASVRGSTKADTVQGSKSGRHMKKHNKTVSNCDRRGGNNPIGSKEMRDKQSKAIKINSKHVSPFNTSTALSTTNLSFSSPLDTTGAHSGPPTPNAMKSLRGAPAQNSHVSMSTQLTDISTTVNDNTISSLESENKFARNGNFPHELPIAKSTLSHGKQKNGHQPQPMRFVTSKAMDTTTSTVGTAGRGGDHGQKICKRDRSNINSCSQSSSKKIKMEKINKSYVSGMTPVDGGNLVKANTAVKAPVNLPEQQSTITDNKMTVGHQKSSAETKADRRSSSRNSANSSKITKSSNTSGSNTGTSGQEFHSLPQGEIETPGERGRSVGTLTTHADIGISTEPESLGPCEPGTNVNLSGIVWHETESGVLVVNVTWRNRSYVGTLLDATKHDWAPPRIPDVDSDVEFRLKSGRPKRQRAANGNALSDGRKSRKSVAAAANNNDEYKCSPSTSNKRRSNKISESDACSGNDGDICATPSKSAKRARMARTAAGKQGVQRAVNTATAVKESSGDGTSGSGSSTCSSPVFVECSFANCKKRYSDETALKYHEVYAHKDEENDKASEKTARDDDSVAAIDSPKHSEIAKSKSADEMLASESNSIPNEPENSTSTSAASPKPMEVQPSSLPQVSPCTQAPFVVTQPAVAMTTSSQIPDKNSCTSICNSNGSNPSVTDKSAFIKKTGGEEARLSAKNFEMTHQTSQAAERVDRAHSPYTLTDSLTNESISLKTHTNNKTPARSYHPRSATTYGDVQGLPSSQAALIEHSNAVDNESAQAVQTLLQLQENSHDQLPGLTPYSQPSRSTPLQVSKDLPSSTSSSVSFAQVPGDKFPRGPSPESLAKPQHHGIVSPHFRGHSKDGTPLPRMTVRVSSPRNQYGNGQFVNVNYPHSANSSQERAVHNASSSGLKIVKGKTVPIPTDPQQNLSQSQSANAVASISSVPSTKKQKRKKQRSDYCSKSPSEMVSKIIANDPQDHGRVKQEYQPGAGALPLHTLGRGPQDVDCRPLMASSSHPHLREGDIKTEPISNISSGAKPPDNPQVSACPAPRTKPQNQTDMRSRDQVQQQLLQSGGKTSTNKAPQMRAPSEHATPSRSSQHGSHSGFVEERADIRGKSQHPPSLSRHEQSHSLPGSGSLTPINSGNHIASKISRQSKSQAPSNPNANAPGIPPSREAVARALVGSRVMTGEGPSEQKRNLGPPQPVYEPFPLPEFMHHHHPRLTRFFEQVITQEYQKEQKPKEQQRDISQGSSRLVRSTPSPAEAAKQARSTSPVKEGRRNAESPIIGQPHFSSPYPSQIQPPSQRVLHNVTQRGSTPRASPVPSESMPSRLVGGVPRGPSPRISPPPTHTGKRPPRPNSGAEKFHRREQSLDGERPSTASRTPTATPVRKQQMKDGYPDQTIQSPEKKTIGPPPSMYAPPNVQMQIGGNRPPHMQFYPGYPHLIDPRSIASYFPTAAYMFPGNPHLFPSPWPHGAPPPGVSGAVPPEKSQTPHSVKPSRERPSSRSRSPYREENDRISREAPRTRDADAYPVSAERRISDGLAQVRKSVTPDPKASPARGTPGDSEANPPMQRHLHTHHHIHEGFHVLPPHAAQYGYPMAASAVIAGSEAAAALAPYPKREIP